MIRLQAELTRVSDRQGRFNLQRKTLSADLNTLCGRAAETPVLPIPAIARPEVMVDRERLVSLGERHREELLAAGALIQSGEGALELAGQSFRPRFTASVALTNVNGRDARDSALPLPPDEGKNALSVSLGMSLPVWRDKYGAEVEEAHSRLAAHRSRRRGGAGRHGKHRAAGTGPDGNPR